MRRTLLAVALVLVAVVALGGISKRPGTNPTLTLEWQHNNLGGVVTTQPITGECVPGQFTTSGTSVETISCGSETTRQYGAAMLPPGTWLLHSFCGVNYDTTGWGSADEAPVALAEADYSAGGVPVLTDIAASGITMTGSGHSTTPLLNGNPRCSEDINVQITDGISTLVVRYGTPTDASDDADLRATYKATLERIAP